MIEQFKHDQSTVFSIVPFTIHEFKPGLYPGSFKIEACLNDKVPQRLVVGASEHLMHQADAKPIRIVTPSFVIAESLVRDFLDGQLWCDSIAHPGIAWLQGSVAISDFITKHEAMCKEMHDAQIKWFIRLCQQTDNEWAKNKHSRVVSDQARFAAKTLGLKPDWLDVEVAGLIDKRCPACDTRNAPGNAVCINCRCILDEAKYKTLKFATGA